MINIKRVVFITILLLLATAAAASNATITSGKYGTTDFGTSSILTTYEGNLDYYTLAVDNFLQATTITKVILSTPGFITNGVTNFTEWGYTKTTSSIEWFGGTIETNVLAAIFEFELQAPQVSQDTNLTLTLQLRDTLSQIQNLTFEVTVLDDPTAPVLSQSIPSNGSTLAAGTNHTISVITEDLESGIASVSFSYDDCVGGSSTEFILSCTGTNCSKNIDFTSFTESSRICFTFDAENNAGLGAILQGEAFFDATKPTVTLIEQTVQPSLSRFNFTQSDNLASNLQCELYINNILRTSSSFPANTTATLNNSLTDLTEGNHSWLVSCRDEVGLEHNASSTFFHDPNPPIITLNSPANGSGVGNTLIDITVTDNTSITSLTYSLPLNTSTYPEGENNLTVTATDEAGNRGQETFTFYKDLTAPDLTIIGPTNGSSSDVHVNFIFRVDDDFDANPSCTVVTNAGVNKTQLVANGVQSTIQITLPLGDITWSITCEDDVGNSVTSATRTVTTVDTSGPDIAINDLTLVLRGVANTISANITDPSGVASARAVFQGQTITLTQSGDVWTGTFTPALNLTLTNYTIAVIANDTLGFESQADDTFQLVKGYIITLTLSPSTATPNKQITATGTINSDDNLNLSGEKLTLSHPNGVINLTVLGDNSYSTAFTAPSTTGASTITTSYDTPYLVYSVSKILTVQSPSAASGSSGGGSSISNGEEDSLPSPTIASSPNPSPASFEATDTPNTESDSENLVEEVTEEPQGEEEERTAVGVGGATGIFSLQNLKNIWWIFLLVAGILGALYYFAREGRPRHGKKESEPAENENGINWDNYFERNNGP